VLRAALVGHAQQTAGDRALFPQAGFFLHLFREFSVVGCRALRSGPQPRALFGISGHVFSAGTVAGIISRVGRKIGVSSRAELIAALDRPIELERAAGPDGRELLVFSGRSPATEALVELGEAERAVARLAVDGKTNAEIAAARGTSERTVAHQLTSIFKKLGVRSRGELAAKLRDVR
jgi:DNA-binding CsgD family transcriptional regulator